MASEKICVVGAGRVGAALIHNIASRNLCAEILIKDNNNNRAQGICLDIMQSAYLSGSSTSVRILKDVSEIQETKILFFCAGSPRLAGMTRSDLLLANANVVRDVLLECKPHLKNTIVVIVSNPLDAMVYLAQKILDLPRTQVIGMAGVLDGARMAYYIREKLKLKTSKIITTVIGSHGDLMLPLGRFANVGGSPLTDLLTDVEISEIEDRTRNGGAEIVSYLKSGSAFNAPAKAASLMAEAILQDSKEVMCASILLEGEYGFYDVCGGVPMFLGTKGCEKIVEYKLNTSERDNFAKSLESVVELITILKENKII